VIEKDVYFNALFDERLHCILEDPELEQKIISRLTQRNNAAPRAYLVFAESGFTMLGSG
jgi:hypothetical protein